MKVLLRQNKRQNDELRDIEERLKYRHLGNDRLIELLNWEELEIKNKTRPDLSLSQKTQKLQETL